MERLFRLTHVVEADLAIETCRHEHICGCRVDPYLRNSALVTLVLLEGLSLVLLSQIVDLDHTILLASHNIVARGIHRCHDLVVSKNGLLH